MAFGVFVYDDDVTSWEFVETILKNTFNKTHDEARKLMLETHRNGHALCGLYAEEHVRKLEARARDFAEQSGYPLQFATRPVD